MGYGEYVEIAGELVVKDGVFGVKPFPEYELVRLYPIFHVSPNSLYRIKGAVTGRGGVGARKQGFGGKADVRAVQFFGED